MRVAVDIDGVKPPGKPVELHPVGHTAHKKITCLYRCYCGKEFVAIRAGVVSGNTKSCGCWKTERLAQHLKGNTWGKTHGLCHRGTRPRAYTRWSNMKSRCYNPNCPEFARYGGRGIKVCSEWLNDFAKFYSDVGDPPGPGLSMDRIDNNGDYRPGNVRWATAKEQIANARNVFRLRAERGQYESSVRH